MKFLKTKRSKKVSIFIVYVLFVLTYFVDPVIKLTSNIFENVMIILIWQPAIYSASISLLLLILFIPTGLVIAFVLTIMDLFEGRKKP